METIDLNLVRAFVAVHEARSFSGAATRLGVPRSTVSRAVAALEASLRVRLFQRTTRQVSTTTEGLAVYERVAPTLAALESSLADLPEREAAPAGLLRVTAQVDLGPAILAEASARYLARYPGTRLEVNLSNAVVDLVRDGFDLALRVVLRRRRDSTLVARRLGSIASQLYASPAYVARRGAPRVLADLAGHEWATYGAGGVVLDGPSGRTRIAVDAGRRLVCDDMGFLAQALKAGAGVGPLPSFLADAAIASGELVRVMPRWVGRGAGVYLVHPSRKHPSPKVTAFRDLLVELLRQRPLAAADAGA